ncbi:membrane-associated protein, putative [Bodo saltans]|uniref:Membrane-associated protein, putative n=1 Tax=Bodo saltans TaxID=75058 RepID=A0A0S4JF23_BODSA|nr:membrane-associated protein, putative [Bodo saltans]|eukprot:CUG87761.1 membrane-associated protein, putative [Bodo saltans]
MIAAVHAVECFFVLSALRVGVMLLHVVYFSRGRSRGLAAANVMQHASQSALLMAFACLMLEDATTKTGNDGASFNAIHVFAYVVSVTSAVRIVLLTLTFVWETQQSVSALESVVNNIPMNLTFNQKNRRDSKIVSAGQLKNLIYEICNHQRARHTLLRPSLHPRSQ